MYWRVGAAYRRRRPEDNRAAFREIVEQGPAPGLLAFRGDVAVGWCQLTPRSALPWMERARDLRSTDEAPVWCISCFQVRKGYRRGGVTEALIREAVAVARRAGAPALEAYPLDREHAASASFTGFASTFLRLGFEEVARHKPARPILRHRLDA
ncbi:MAG: GNAT family N-acetyltransferase [Acidobacteria bacterium]|nr:GNAT family N-acetyltransferase [Acidobacteriota bacterium]